MAFAFPIRVYWEDTDAGGIVFYANYLRWFERARTEWLRSLGIAQRRLGDEAGGLFVVSEAALKYHAPARLDDEIVVTADLCKKGAASLSIVQQALLKSELCADTGDVGDARASLLCEGSVRVGWVDRRTLKPARIPPTILEKIF